jgi:MYXO-CTERM domain-containing protein
MSGILAATTSAAPSIGGTPIHTEDDFFTGGPWGMMVSSYVFDSDSDLPEGFALADNEMLFIYLLQGDADFDISVDNYSVGNPNLVPVTSVGFSTGIVPDGLNAVDREDPFIFGYSGPAQASVYTFAGDQQDPFSTLDPGEWSLVWYIAESTGWELGSATASGQGIGNDQFVPVPVPGPGALALLGLAGLAGRRRRR